MRQVTIDALCVAHFHARVVLPEVLDLAIPVGHAHPVKIAVIAHRLKKQPFHCTSHHKKSLHFARKNPDFAIDVSAKMN